MLFGLLGGVGPIAWVIGTGMGDVRPCGTDMEDRLLEEDVVEEDMASDYAAAVAAKCAFKRIVMSL